MSETSGTPFRIRRAGALDAPVLTRLMHASGAYGGTYAAILTGYAITAEQVARDHVYLADDGTARPLGFYGLVAAGEAELDLMFVADRAQGLRSGRALLFHMRDLAARLGFDAVTIVSHPPSVGFYLGQGAIRVGTRSPSGKVAWERPVLMLRTTGRDA